MGQLGVFHLYHLFHAKWALSGEKKIALSLSVDVFSRKVLIGDTIFKSGLVETGPPFYVVIRATQRSTRLQGKGSTFISQLF